MKNAIEKFIQTVSDAVQRFEQDVSENIHMHGEHGIFDTPHTRKFFKIACWVIVILSLFMIVWHICMRFL
jgi:t-SNARE complex subunit (syntaxin)